MPNNFQQWNPAAVNQQDDSAYTADAMRTGGAVTGIFASDLANKLFYQCTTMVSALGESLSNKGYTISDASISTLITALSNILTKADFGTTAGTACQGNDARFIPVGTKMWFYQNTAPTGWVIDSTPADAILAVKGGSAAYNVNGGMAAGTWTHPTHTHTGPSHTHTGPSHAHSILTHTHTFSAGAHTHAFTGTAHTHTFSSVGSHTHTTGSLTLTAAQSGLPAHTHTYLVNYANNEYISSDNWYSIIGRQTSGTTNANVAQNASESHNHGATGAATVSGTTGGSNTENTGTEGTGTTSASGTGDTGAAGTGATGASSTANTWRPLAQVGIICTKS